MKTLEDMTRDELRAVAKEQGVKGAGKMSVAQLRAALVGYQPEPPMKAAAAKKSKAKKATHVEREDGRMVLWEERNGVRPPSREGTLVQRIWQMLEEVCGNSGGDEPPTLGEAKEHGEGMGLNLTNVTIEYYRWRRWAGFPCERKGGPGRPKKQQ